MEKLKFSTVKFVPNSARDEPVNIGVFLYDFEEQKIYSKFTNNWKKVSQRAGVAVDLSNFVQDINMKLGNEFLSTIYHDLQITDSLHITSPKHISLVENINNTLEFLFDIQISVSQIK